MLTNLEGQSVARVMVRAWQLAAHDGAGPVNGTAPGGTGHGQAVPVVSRIAASGLAVGPGAPP